jgi:hypothetical protein
VAVNVDDILMNLLMVPVSAGELFDKITILQIKQERIADPAKLANVRLELSLLNDAAAALPTADPEVQALLAELKSINETIWDAEDLVREFERTGAFGEPFVNNARATYRNNDRRARAKRRLNELLGSTLVEEKSHARPKRPVG